MASAPITLLIASDIRLYKEGLRDALRDDPRFDIVACANSLSAGVAGLRATAQSIDVALADLDRSDAPQQLEIARRDAPRMRIVVLGVREEDEDVIGWAELGVDGFVSRNATLADLGAAVECVVRGELSCTPRMVAALMRRVASVGAPAARRRTTARLTDRETEILELIAGGLTNKAIARRLQIELPTVKNHVHHILEKLEVDGRGEAAARLRDGRGSMEPVPEY